MTDHWHTGGYLKWVILIDNCLGLIHFQRLQFFDYRKCLCFLVILLWKPFIKVRQHCLLTRPGGVSCRAYLSQCVFQSVVALLIGSDLGNTVSQGRLILFVDRWRHCWLSAVGMVYILRNIKVWFHLQLLNERTIVADIWIWKGGFFHILHIFCFHSPVTHI